VTESSSTFFENSFTSKPIVSNNAGDKWRANRSSLDVSNLDTLFKVV